MWMQSERQTRRTIWPLVVAYFTGSALTGAWCELRNDFHSFHADCIQGLRVTDDPFDGGDGALQQEYLDQITCPNADIRAEGVDR